MDSMTEGELVHKAEMLEMDFLKDLGIDPNFADIRRRRRRLFKDGTFQVHKEGGNCTALR